jgi:ABC-type nitrate/sulfonate/bicarbonate transport system substrate-binding protein/CheY-like chemotaxis protein
MSINTDLSILIVDDSGTMLKIMQKNLNDAGFSNITTACDGKDATGKLATTKIDLIISDWNMPTMDGMELLQWVRKSDKFAKLPFIMATAQADRTQQLAVKNEGGQGLLPKPFDGKELKAIIEEIFGQPEKKKEPRREAKMVNGKVQLKIAHIQITDHLALGILKHQIETGQVKPKYFDLETVCLPGWNPVIKALETGDVDAAFVLAPIAMDLFGFEVPIKLVMLAHKSGSIFVRSKNYNPENYNSLKDFYKYKVVDIPHKMSIHNMLAHKYLKEMGLKPGVPGKELINVRFEVVPPIQMPEIMKTNDNVAGFIVAEPIGSNAIAKGIADLEFISAEQWDNHPCCVCTMQQDFIEKHTNAVFEFTELLATAGKYIEHNKNVAAEVAVSFLDPQQKLGLTTDMLKNVLEMPNGIGMADLYPVIDDLDRIQQYMHHEMGIGVIIDLEKFVDLQFANEACK